MGYFVFENPWMGDLNTQSLGIVISKKRIRNLPARDVTSIHVPGRNGDIMIDSASYQNVEVTYLGMPSAAYRVGDFTVGKTGAVSGPDNSSLIPALQERGFTPADVAWDADTTSEPATPNNAPEHPGAPSDDPAAYLPPVTMSASTRASEHRAAVLGFGANAEDYLAPDTKWCTDTSRPNDLIILLPLDAAPYGKHQHLLKMAEAKLGMITAAFEAEAFECGVSDDGLWLGFAWRGRPAAPTAEEVHAASTLAAAMCAAARQKQRVTAKAREPENQKYAFRCWLLSLGLIGPEYKLARANLLRRLPGNSAYKSPAAGEAGSFASLAEYAESLLDHYDD